MSSTASSVAARLKRSAEATGSSAPSPKRPASSQLHATGLQFSAGDNVLANFKGLGDWDEAVVVGVHPDNTYTLEYTDEGLIEEGVPPTRIRSADAAPVASKREEPLPAAQYAAGDAVMANFKGLGDWDEALIVGVGADGTYSVEYVDEGLLEEGVPSERLAPLGGADALSSAMAASGRPVAFDDDEREPTEEAAALGGGYSPPGPPARGGEETTSAAAVLASTAAFVACSGWLGPKPGYCFKDSTEYGVGYHKDVPLHVAAEEEEKARMVLTAAQLANWSVEMLAMPPSVSKVDRYMELFDLPALRVQSLSAAPSSAARTTTASAKPAAAGRAPSTALFESLQAWFDAQLGVLARQCSPSEIEVTHRVFLAPQQSVRQGLQHVTFSVDWVSVSAMCDAEPLSGALLQRMELTGRRPARKMLLVVLYRAEHNKITHVWAELDREGLGSKPKTTLDDVLLSDAFDRALTLARKSGAVGELEPHFYNYHEAPVVGM